MKVSVRRKLITGILSVAASLAFLPNAHAFLTNFVFWTPCGELDSGWTPSWSNLKAYLKLNETTTGTAPGGTDFLDSTGNGNNGTQVNGVTLDQAGKFGEAVSFTANASSYITLPISGANTTNGQQVTVAFWMNWNGNGGTSSGWAVAFAFSSGLSITFNNNGHFGFCTENEDLYGLSSAGIPTNTWVHVAAVIKNGSLTSNKIYINGVSQSLSQLDGTPTAANEKAATSGYIGNLDGTDVFNFQGLIDDVAVFNGALTAAQISTIYNRQVNLSRTCR